MEYNRLHISQNAWAYIELAQSWKFLMGYDVLRYNKTKCVMWNKLAPFIHEVICKYFSCDLINIEHSHYQSKLSLRKAIELSQILRCGPKRCIWGVLYPKKVCF